MIFEDCQRLKENPQMFWSYTDEFIKYSLRDKLIEIFDIFTSKNMENTPLKFRM